MRKTRNDMSNIFKMTNGELKKVLAETQKELARRDRMAKALADIKKVLTNYQFKAEDIDWGQLNKSPEPKQSKRNGNSKSNTAKKLKAKKRSKRDQRSTVVPKYSNPNGNEQWTGRGRAPKWVVDICEKENIDVKNFKINSRYKI